jgi:hypothetical protein
MEKALPSHGPWPAPQAMFDAAPFAEQDGHNPTVQTKVNKEHP